MDTHKMARHDVFETTIDEDVTLEQLGYQQEFKRSFSLLDMIGFSFSIVTWCESHPIPVSVYIGQP